jgi:hypothetical protein
VSPYCPKVYFGDMVALNGLVGIVDEEWSRYDPEGKRAGWRKVLFVDGTYAWGPPADLERLHAEFIGMPNKGHYPEFGEPLTLWQQIPHGYNEYLTWDMDAGCMFCGLPEASEIHP